MAYIYKGLDGDKLLILDDEDFVTESISYSDIQYLMLDGTKIQGLSLKRNKVYAGDICLEPKKTKNTNLTNAKKAKNDEFYTQLSDIEKELSHYPIETFKDKVIYCPMDVATNTGAILQSQFVKYFQMNAHRLQFKKLIATCLVEKATGDGVSQEEAQNCYILERKTVDMSQRYIHSYVNGEGKTNPVVNEIDDFGLKYIREDDSQHPVPYHIVNQAVTEPDGKITIIAQYIDHYDECTGKPVICDTYKGVNWAFKGHTLKIKWCRKHPDGTIEMLPDECYFFNNNDVINDFSIFPKDENGNPCYEDVEGGTVCLYPAEYYDYQELEYDDYEEYFAHCPEDSSEFGGSGDFRSDYCTRLLSECDIVVTNPPFSLFRDVLKWIMNANKRFLIIGNQNAFTYKEVFPLIKDGKIWLGSQKGVNNDQYFEMDKSYPLSENVRAQVEKKFSKEFLKDHNMTRLPGCCWFTNCNHDTRFDKMVLLTKQDNENTGYIYEKYDNYDAIEVSRVPKIPSDYDGVMGVPITFLYQYNPDQFEIVNANDYRLGDTPEKSTMLIKDKEATITDNTGHTHQLCTNLHQKENFLVQVQTDGILMERESMQESLSNAYYDMVARPIINDKKVYRRVFIIHRKDENGRLI